MSLRVAHALLVRLVVFIVNTKMRIFFTFKLGWVIIPYCYKNMSVVCCFRKWPYKGVLTGKELPPNP